MNAKEYSENPQLDLLKDKIERYRIMNPRTDKEIMIIAHDIVKSLKNKLITEREAFDLFEHLPH